MVPGGIWGGLNVILKAPAHSNTYAGDTFYQRFCRDAVDVDAYSLQGRVMQASKSTAVNLYKRTEYEIWKLKFYYGH